MLISALCKFNSGLRKCKRSLLFPYSIDHFAPLPWGIHIDWAWRQLLLRLIWTRQSLYRHSMKKQKNHLWWTRFKAYAAVKKFAHAIKRNADPNLPKTEGTDVSESPTQNLALKTNMLAVAFLTMAFQTEGLLNLLYKSESSDWPSGKAHTVIDLGNDWIEYQSKASRSKGAI